MTDWKAESRKWERRAKTNARALDAALAELEATRTDPVTTTLQKIDARLARIEATIELDYDDTEDTNE